MTANIKKYREEAIIHMIDDIKYMEDREIPVDEMWESIVPDNYSYYCTEEDKVKAFEKAGYTVTFE